MDLNLSDFTEDLHAVDIKIKSSEELTQALKRYRNTLVPISRLPAEVLITIFSFAVLLPSFDDPKSSLPIAPFSLSYVCHRWREISLNLPHLYSQINFTKLTLAGSAEMLALAKMTPLHLEAVTKEWSKAKIEAFEEQIQAHIHHTRHLSISAPRGLKQILKQLVSSAPSLEQFSVTDLDEDGQSPSPVIPDNLFDGIAPKLIYLRLNGCGINWKSPLLKGLRDLKLYSYPIHENYFRALLNALKQIPQLERLTLHDGFPIHSDHSLLSLPVKPGLIIVLSSLTELDISTWAEDCRIILAYIFLPVLARLSVKAQADYGRSVDVQHLIPYVVRSAHGPQDTEALQSLFIRGDKTQAEVVAWTAPGKGTNDADEIPSARVAFSTIDKKWQYSTDTPIYDSLLTALPLNSITSLTVKGRTPLSREVWRSHAPRLHKLQRVCLFSTAVPAFREVIKDALRFGLLLPSSEELVLIVVSLNAQKVNYLYEMLNDLVILKIPLMTLDLRSCSAGSNKEEIRDPWRGGRK